MPLRYLRRLRISGLAERHVGLLCSMVVVVV